MAQNAKSNSSTQASTHVSSTFHISPYQAKVGGGIGLGVLFLFFLICMAILIVIYSFRYPTTITLGDVWNWEAFTGMFKYLAKKWVVSKGEDPDETNTFIDGIPQSAHTWNILYYVLVNRWLPPAIDKEVEKK